MAWALIPLGLLGMGGIAGTATGIACTTGACHTNKRNNVLDEYLQAAIFHFNTTSAVNLAAYRNINISASLDLANTRAVFSHADGDTEGMLTGYPSTSPEGLMQGELSFTVPGVEQTPITGTWIAVNQTVATNETKQAFEFILELAEKTAEHLQKMDLETLREELEVVLSMLG